MYYDLMPSRVAETGILQDALCFAYGRWRREKRIVTAKTTIPVKIIVVMMIDRDDGCRSYGLGELWTVNKLGREAVCMYE